MTDTNRSSVSFLFFAADNDESTREFSLPLLLVQFISKKSSLSIDEKNNNSSSSAVNQKQYNSFWTLFFSR